MNYYDKDGKRKTKSVSTKLKCNKKNKKQANEMLIALRTNFSPERWDENSSLVEKAISKINPTTGEIDISFSGFILDWLEIIKHDIAPSTYSSYSNSITKKIVPYFKKSGYTLKDLENNPKYIQDYYQYEF